MIVGHTRIELLSNLPTAEIVKVAEGLAVVSPFFACDSRTGMI
jgi:hypothetical protein